MRVFLKKKNPFSTFHRSCIVFRRFGEEQTKVIAGIVVEILPLHGENLRAELTVLCNGRLERKARRIFERKTNGNASNKKNRSHKIEIGFWGKI